MNFTTWLFKHLIVTLSFALAYPLFLNPVALLLYFSHLDTAQLSGSGVEQHDRADASQANAFVLGVDARYSKGPREPMMVNHPPAPVEGDNVELIGSESAQAPIFFPSPMQMTPFVVNQKPRCADSQEFCEFDTDYNVNVERRFEQLLYDSNLMNDVFSDILVENKSPGKVDVTHVRSGGGLQSETPACLSYETIIYPKRGKTLSQDWVFVLNQGETRQGVRVELCYTEGSVCTAGSGILHHTACRQKFIYKKMLTMDASGSTILPERVFLPSCCVCYVQSDFVQTRTRTSRNQTEDRSGG